MTAYEYINILYLNNFKHNLSSFLNTYLISLKEDIYLKNEDLKKEDILKYLNKHIYIFIGDAKKIVFLLEVYKENVYIHKEYNSALHFFYENKEFGDLIKQLGRDVDGKIEKRQLF